MIYVGFTDNPDRRLKEHFWLVANESNTYLHCSMRKRGIENFTFEVIYQSLDGENCLKEWEKYFILKYNSFTPNGYNLTLGGEGMIGYKHTDKTRKNMSEAKKGKKNFNYGKRQTEEHKQKNREAHTGKNNPLYGKFGVDNPNYGKTPWNKGIPCSKESKQKQIETKRKNKEAKSKQLSDMKTILA